MALIQQDKSSIMHSSHTFPLETLSPEARQASGIQRILVPTDFSEGAEEALKGAVSLAANFQAELILYHCVGLQMQATEFLINPLDLLKKNAADRLQEIRDEVLGWFEKGKAVKVSADVEAGFPAENIIRFAEDVEADLIVLGAHGEAGSFARIFGSTTGEVMRRAQRPVLVVPRETEPRRFNRVVLGADLSPLTPQSLAPALGLCRAFGATLEVVHVICPQAHFSPSAWTEYQARLGEMTDGLEVEYHTYETQSSHASDALRDYARFRKADLLVMVTHDRGFFGRLFKRSETQALSLEANLPILALHGKK